MTSFTHPMDVARKDYRPHLATVQSDVISQSPRPAGLRAGLDVGIPVEWKPVTAANFAVLWGALQFCFWQLHAGKLERYQEGGVVGANLLTAKLLKAWGTAEVSSQVAARFKEGGVEAVLGNIPLPVERHVILREQLVDVGGLGTAVNTLLAALEPKQRYVTVEDAAVLARVFPHSYADRYLKKAQLTLAAFAGWASKTGQLVAVDELTAFADYQVPRLLRHLGFITYAPELARAVDGQMPLASGSEEENAIRAATLIACDELAQAWKCSPAAVDGWLWHARNEARDPFHLTYTSHY